MTIFALIILFFLGIFSQRVLFNWGFYFRVNYNCYFTIEETFEGDELYFVEVIYNRNIFPVPWMRVEINSSRWLEFANSNSSVAQDKRYITSNFALKGYQKVTRKWHLKCLKRGVYDINKITLISGDLFGTMRYSRPIEVKAKLLVFPKKLNLKNFVYPKSQVSGVNFVRRWINEDPFTYQGTRQYIPGDPINRIDWKSTSRTGEVIVRKNDYTSKDDLTVITNVQSQDNEYFGAVDRSIVELCIKVSATVIESASKDKIPVRLLTNGTYKELKNDYIKTNARSGKNHIYNLYRVLSKLELKSQIVFNKLIEVEWKNLNNTQVILITSYLNEILIEYLFKCNLKKKLKILVILADYHEIDFDLKGIEVFNLNKNFLEENKIKAVYK